MTFISALPWIIAAVLGIAFFLKNRKPSEALQNGKLEAELARLKSEKDELSGKGKQLFIANEQLKAEYKAQTKEVEMLSKRIANFEAREEQKEKELHNNVAELKAAKQSLEDEKIRIRREDEAERQRLEAERDRIWAEHETATIAHLAELCKLPELLFTNYSNTTLPEEFDGSLKPDFLIELLGQYVIFDAKASKAKSLQTYINDTVKKTVQKVKGNDKIARMIFLVVPMHAIHELKSCTTFQEGYTFYIVSREALAPILASLKRIEVYEFAEKLDPQERENIIHLIAKLATHIHSRNSYDVLMAQKGSEILDEAERIDANLSREVSLEQAKIKLPSFKQSDVKKFMNRDARDQEILKLTQPRAAIAKKDIESMQEMLVKE